MRKRLGYVDEQPLRVPRRAQLSMQAVPLVSSSPAPKVAEPARVVHSARQAALRDEMSTPMSQQLLAAKRRAAKR
jgi:hypothetical protein